MDRSAQGELLRINFNISYPALSCEFATLDVSDALGTVRSGFLRACMLSSAVLSHMRGLHRGACDQGRTI